MLLTTVFIFSIYIKKKKKKKADQHNVSPTSGLICSTTLNTFLSLTLHNEGRAVADMLPPSTRFSL